MRPEYKRSAFASLEQGKFYTEVAEGTTVALLEPAIAKAFPTSQAVNEALASLLALAEKILTTKRNTTRTRAKTEHSG